MGANKRHPPGHSLLWPWLPHHPPTRSTCLGWPQGPTGRGWAAATPCT